MQVVYDYNKDQKYGGYIVKVYDDDGECIDDTYFARILERRDVSISQLRRWAIESALDFMESYDVDGDPVRDTTIRGGKR